MTFLRFTFVFLLCVFTFTVAQAQDTKSDVAPDFTAQTLETRIKALDGNAELSDEQKDQIRTSLQAAVDRLADATRQSERRLQFVTAVENADAFQAELDLELKAAQETLAAEAKPMAEMIGDDALFELEQDLNAKQSDLGEIETRLQGLQDTLNVLAARQISAPKELAEARVALSDLQTRLNALGASGLEDVSDARRIEARARVWYRRNQIRALEQEIETLPERQELLTARRAVADIRAQILRKDVARLSSRTGQKRVNEARALRDAIAADAAALKDGHPLLASFASDNLGLADQIAKLASGAPEISQATASVRGRVVEVENDLTAATSLVKQGRLDREAGAILRRLGNQLQTPDSIRVDIKSAQDKQSAAARQRIIAQEDLRDLPIGPVDFTAALTSARRDAPDLPDLTEAEQGSLTDILNTRRSLLQQISKQSTARIGEVGDLLVAQGALLEKTESLQTLLDGNLLWVRSVPSVDFSFPQKVGLGAIKLFSPKNLSLALSELILMSRSFGLVVFGFLVIIGLIVRLRPRLRAEVDRRAKLVGRVKQDSAWHTPAVIAIGILNSLPLSLLFLLLGLLYGASSNPDRLIEGLANGFLYLSLFSLLFGAWIRWDREKGLFDAHFKLSSGLRRTIGVNLRWFVPVMGTFSTLLAITKDLTDTNIAEGFSVFVFILTGLSIVVFAARIIWSKLVKTSELGRDESVLSRFRGPISAVVIGMPLVTIGLAVAGYYESANQLNMRMFLTGALVLLTYVIYGAIRRAIVVAQRQIKYRQALERRESELKARREKEAAEQRGEEMRPPPVDTAEIDVTTITRQTSKLLQTAILLAFAVLLWMIWSSLVPALSIFDGFEVWSYKTGEIDIDNKPISVAVSLWDVLQSLVIIVLTFIAARNLPGFLEIFVLNRLGVDPGTRYAVTTILGYIIVAAGIIIGFNQLGLQWSQLRWIATGLSVGIGFGLQKIIANFVSGLIILFERPIRIGDYVTIGEQSGVVSKIRIRATTLNDLDNLEILIPNEALISERVTNWTLSNSITRLIVRVGIAYGSDTDRARDLMLETVRAQAKVLETPAPQVLFMGFGDSSLDFEIRVYLRNFEDRVPTRHALHTEINKTLAKAGISIPFPQRDLNIVSQEIPLEILSRIQSKPKPQPKPKPKPKGKPSAGPQGSDIEK
jgi:potassium efflux system protein